MNRVSSVIFSLENEWLLSVGKDKYLQWHDCTTGKRLGGYQTGAWCTSLQYPLSFLKSPLHYQILIYSPTDSTMNRFSFDTQFNAGGPTQVVKLCSEGNILYSVFPIVSLNFKVASTCKSSVWWTWASRGGGVMSPSNFQKLYGWRCDPTHFGGNQD